MEKKEMFVFFALFLVIINTIIIAQDANNLGTNVNLNVSLDADSVSNLTSSIDKIDNRLEENFIVPEGWEKVFKGLLGIENQISLSQFIIIICLWFFFFILIAIFLKDFDFFGSELASWIISFIIACLLGVSKGLFEGSKYLIIFFDFGFLAKWAIIKILFIIILLVLLFFILKFFNDMFEKDRRITTAKIRGAQAGAGIAIARQNLKRP